MINGKTLKILSIVTTIVGVGISLLSSWVDDKQMDEKIGEKLEVLLSKNMEKGS